MKEKQFGSVVDSVTIELENMKKISWKDHLLLNKSLKVALLLLITAIVTPILLYNYIYISSMEFPPSDGFSAGSCVVSRESRLTCGNGNTSDTCHAQCCYDHNSSLCFHRLPSRFSYLTNDNWQEDSLLRPRQSTIPYKSQPSLENLKLSIDEITDTHLSLTFYNSKFHKFEGNRIPNKSYSYDVRSQELNVEVFGQQGLLFSFASGYLIASKNIWEIAFKLTEETMYGLDEIPLKETSKVIYNNDKGMNSIPLIFAYSNSSYHGLFIDTESPSEVLIKQENDIVIRSITNSFLRLHIFIGPEPINIMNDAMKYLGYNNNLEYWTLGLHVCSEIPHNISQKYNDLDSFIQHASDQQMPFESHCGVTPIVFGELCDSQSQEILKSGAVLVKYYGKRYVPHVSPFIITENESCELDLTDIWKKLLLHNQTSEVYKGSYKQLDIVYPLYKNVTKNEMEILWNKSWEIDGLILENSWPLDETKQNLHEAYSYLPYFSKNLENSFENTPQWNARIPTSRKLYYTEHNNYGNYFVQAFNKIFQNISKYSSGSFKDLNSIVNRQNVDISWDNLRRELVRAALGGISGHWLWSTPICGDTENFTIETQTDLCLKWYKASSFMPMIKLHSKMISKNPFSFSGTIKNYMISALKLRISLLPYYFTVLQNGPLLRPMFFQYPMVNYLRELTSQFSVGDILLIVPNLQPLQNYVNVWLPPNTTWYELGGGLKIQASEGDAISMATTDADFLVLIKGGSILVMHENVFETAEKTRMESPFALVIALDINNNTDQRQEMAKGILYLSQNLTLHIHSSASNLKISAEGSDCDVLCNETTMNWSSSLKSVKIYGGQVEDNAYEYIEVNIDLCDIQYGEINYNFH